MADTSAAMTDTSTAMTDTTMAAAAGDTSASATADGAVAIKDFSFTPKDITVKVGTAVTWTNGDDFAHSIESGDGSFDSEKLDSGATFSHTFDTAGTFKYRCGIHNSMTGSVVVEP